MMNDLQIVLVEPLGDGNIGSAARAMKNFGLSELVLVRPVPFNTSRGREMACSALDILETARVSESLKEAVGSATYVAGFTARTGKGRRPIHKYDDAIKTIVRRLESGSVALVFGREDDGLTNEELETCDATVTIPTCFEYSSLNLAQAVLVVCSDVFRCGNFSGAESVSEDRFVSRNESACLMELIKTTLHGLNYDVSDGDSLGQNILARLAGIFGRAGLTNADLRMIEGLCSRIGRG